MRPVEIGRRISASRDPVAACARVLGIRLYRFTDWHGTNACDPGRFSFGPFGGAIDLSRRAVHVNGGKLNLSERLQPYHALHELAHALCDPPPEIAEYIEEGGGLCETNEVWILTQVEAAYGKAILPARDYRRLIEIQNRLEIADEDEAPVALGEINPWTLPWWREGYAIARRVGLLDGNNRPTFRKPDWSKL